ncbi:MAG: T9SS type A sorting domain-containing protein [Bacteroidales bacterium]|nr:T9SS type A sorting domain-containing protein [Bacteroidales bacterium]
MKNCRNFLVTVLLMFSIKIIFTPYAGAQTSMQLNVIQPAELIANAGTDVTIDVGNSTILGGTPAATGGTGSLTYQWSFDTYLDNGTTENPTATPPGNLTFTLTATDERGCTANDEVSVTVIGGTSVKENETEALVKLFPNPTSGAFTLSIEQVKSSEFAISIISLSGTKVFETIVKPTGNTLTTDIDISNLARGCYFLRITGNRESIIRQIVLH